MTGGLDAGIGLSPYSHWTRWAQRDNHIPVTGIPYKTLGTREVERFLSGFHDIADAQHSAYAGRLKHLSRGGFPAGISAGPGIPAQYDADQFFQMVVVTELWQFGVPPARAIALVSEAWPRLREDVLRVWLAVDASEHSGKPADIQPVFWRVPVEALRHMARPGRPYSPDSADTLDVMTFEGTDAMMKRDGYDVRRHAFIVAHQLIQDALTQLGYQLGGPYALAAFMQRMIPAPTVQV